MRWKDLTGQDVHFESDILASTLIYYLPIRGGQINGLKNSEDHDYQSLKNGQGGQIKVVRKGGQKQGEETIRVIVEAMRQNPEISRAQLSKVAGISPSAIQKHIDCQEDLHKPPCRGAASYRHCGPVRKSSPRPYGHV